MYKQHKNIYIPNLKKNKNKKTSKKINKNIPPYIYKYESNIINPENNNLKYIEFINDESNKNVNSKKKSSLNDDFLQQKIKQKKNELKRLQDMSNIENNINNNDHKNINDLTLSEILNNCKIMWIEIIKKFNLSRLFSYSYLNSFFNINNRKFYLGISLIIFGLILFIFDTLLLG